MSGDFAEGPPKRPEALPLDETESAEDDLPAAIIERPSSEDVLFAVAAHIGGFLTIILVPLILYFIQRDRRSLAAWHAREAFNFNLTLVVYFLIDLLLFGLGFIDLWLLLIPAALYGILLLFQLGVVVVATVMAGMGKYFRCPLTIPFIQIGAWFWRLLASGDAS